MAERTTKNTHGGANRGQGLKPMGDEPKQPKTYKLDIAVIKKLDELSKKSGHSRAAIIEYAILGISKLPDRLK